MLTFCFLLGHDSVTEGQQTEEVLHPWRAQFHGLHQLMVIKTELWVGQWVPGEVYFFCFLQIRKDTGTYFFLLVVRLFVVSHGYKLFNSFCLRNAVIE